MSVLYFIFWWKKLELQKMTESASPQIPTLAPTPVSRTEGYLYFI